MPRLMSVAHRVDLPGGPVVSKTPPPPPPKPKNDQGSGSNAGKAPHKTAGPPKTGK